MALQDKHPVNHVLLVTMETVRPAQPALLTPMLTCGLERLLRRGTAKHVPQVSPQVALPDKHPVNHVLLVTMVTVKHAPPALKTHLFLRGM